LVEDLVVLVLEVESTLSRGATVAGYKTVILTQDNYAVVKIYGDRPAQLQLGQLVFLEEILNLKTRKVV
jgi:hypothetical protein